ncbi:transcriptional regulator with XRE-family HTH domain [Azospirillum fermentarium]|uniref:helix-turn-helix domain-containing protein n=1 Tax=Azospirillum fermentarium TaxID=1233114 RepID=UPI002227470C|nr:helix-turn-helix transcriptional regulator [Azospirillum fermentarium]MCW2246177.1 transcriptional regulator with XRE-family HTH domain [Azospirillum fermentarium]
MIDAYPSKSAAARAAGVTAEQLSRYVKGINRAPFDTLVKLCAPVGVSLDWVATGCGRMAAARGQASGDLTMTETLLNNLIAGLEIHKARTGLRIPPLTQARLVVLYFRLLSRRLDAVGGPTPADALLLPGTPVDIAADHDLADILALAVGHPE